MSVFVDDMEAQFGRMVMCHMWADTYDELRNMALAIDVPFKWLQHPPYASWVHMDISKSKRELAVAHGAVQMRWRDCVRYAKAQPYNATYAVFYVDHWKYSRYRYDYETHTLTMKEPRVHAANDWLDDDIPF